jgi:hypothetical protein
MSSNEEKLPCDLGDEVFLFHCENCENWERDLHASFMKPCPKGCWEKKRGSFCSWCKYTSCIRMMKDYLFSVPLHEIEKRISTMMKFMRMNGIPIEPKHMVDLMKWCYSRVNFLKDKSDRYDYFLIVLKVLLYEGLDVKSDGSEGRNLMNLAEEDEKINEILASNIGLNEDIKPAKQG